MRIGLVIYGSLDTSSGGYLYDRMLVDALRASGDTVEVFSQPWRGFAAGIAQNFHRSFFDSLLRSRLQLLVQDELNHASLFLANRRMSRRSAVPAVAIVHNLKASEDRPAAARRVYAAVERSFLDGLAGCVFNSNATRLSVERLLGRRVEGVVATPAGDRFGEAAREQDVLDRCSQPGPLRILFVANLIRRKGLFTLLEALSRLGKDGWILDVVGSPEPDRGHAAAVQAFVAGRGLSGAVRIRGHLDQASLAREYRSHHVLAVPSSYEGFGIVYLEAMCFGVVPVGTTAGGAGEIIQDGRSGFLIAPGDSRGLADLLRRFLGDRQFLCARALDALGRFREMPGWKQSMGGAVSYLHAVAAKGGT